MNMFLCLRCAWRRARASGWLALLATEFAVRAVHAVCLVAGRGGAGRRGGALPGGRIVRLLSEELSCSGHGNWVWLVDFPLCAC